MFQIPRGKFVSVENGLNPQRARPADSSAPPPAARAAGELDLRFLWHRRWWIAASVAASLLVAYAADLLITPRYRAAAQILIGPVDLRVIEKDVMPLTQTADANVIQVESETRVLTSDKVLLRVVEGEELASDPEFRARAAAAACARRSPRCWRRSGESGGPRGRGTADHRVARAQARGLRGAQRANLCRRSHGRYRDPDKSARIANAVARAYLDEQSAARTAAARRASDSLIARLAELKSRVQRAEENVQRYKSDNDMVGAGGMSWCRISS